jgi:hypothetical protein
VLLDNVANGWTYNAITLGDVATKDLAATSAVSESENKREKEREIDRERERALTEWSSPLCIIFGEEECV